MLDGNSTFREGTISDVCRQMVIYPNLDTVPLALDTIVIPFTAPVAITGDFIEIFKRFFAGWIYPTPLDPVEGTREAVKDFTLVSDWGRIAAKCDSRIVILQRRFDFSD